jgi:hypothetical protein
MLGTRVTLSNAALLIPALVLFRASSSPAEPTRAADLPRAITLRLDAEYPGWQIASMSEESAGYWRQEYPDKPANVLRGDFDGNGLRDYAVLIAYPDATADGHPLQFRRALVFLRTRTGFRSVLLTESILVVPREELHFWPVPKGAKGEDLNTNRAFIYERDAIAVLLDHGGPCTTFIYRAGKFVSIWTCD